MDDDSYSADGLCVTCYTEQQMDLEFEEYLQELEGTEELDFEGELDE